MEIKIKIKRNVGIYINMVLTLWYEKQLKKPIEILIIYFDKYYFILINSKENTFIVHVFLIIV